VRIGEIHQQEGNTDAAKACFQEVLIKAPESPYTAGRLQALFTAERDAQAEAFWRYLAELHPEAQLPRDYLAKRGALYGAAE
jgi:predicted TPR repeat methyltransferase